MRGRRRFVSLSWLAMGVVLVGALAFGATADRQPRTESERVQALAAEVRCPTCQNLSAAESDAKAAQAVRDEIRTRVRRGETNDEIKAYLVSRFGREIILKPETRGLAALVWVMPVVAGLAAVGGLVLVFRRWRQEAPPPASAQDRALVEEALRP